MKPVVKFRRLRPSAKLPDYQTVGAVGMDLSADLDGAIELTPGERRAVSTGWAVEIPAGFEGQVRPRSGRAIAEGLTLINPPGTIDSDYRGEIKVLLVNLGAAPVRIASGDRIAQLVIAPVARAEIVEASDLAGSERGSGGFGHTGR